MTSDGRLFILSSPSGCGKSTVIRELLRRNQDFHYSISATTRAPRTGERHGVDYTFLPMAEFKRKIEEGAFYEYAQVHGNYYGTLKENIEPLLRNGKVLLLDLDVQGALYIKNNILLPLLIFLLPPSLEVLRRRLVDRSTENPEHISERLRIAENEIGMADQYDVQIINDRLDLTVHELEQIIRFY